MTNLRATEDDVRYAYRLLLGRDPDATGFANFRKYIAENGVTAPDVAASFFSSEEFRNRNTIVPTLDEIEFKGLKLYPWIGDSQIGAHIKATGDYEPYMLPIFIDAVPVGGTVLDIGANIGTYTLSAARKVGEAGRVFAIEPVARNVHSLCAGVVGNGFRNVSVLPVAASAEAGVVPMIRRADSSNGIVDVHVNPAAADGFVAAQRIDFLLGAIDRLDVIKIDIEGHEPVAWRGLERLVERYRPVVFTEFSPIAIRNHSRVEPEIYLAALFAYSSTLDVLHIDGRRVECSTPEQVMEQWRDINQRLGREGTHHLDLVVDARIAKSVGVTNTTERCS